MAMLPTGIAFCAERAMPGSRAESKHLACRVSWTPATNQRHLATRRVGGRFARAGSAMMQRGCLGGVCAKRGPEPSSDQRTRNGTHCATCKPLAEEAGGLAADHLNHRRVISWQIHALELL